MRAILQPAGRAHCCPVLKGHGPGGSSGISPQHPQNFSVMSLAVGQEYENKIHLLHDRVQPFCGSQESALHIPLAIFYVVQGKVTDRGCSSCAPLCYNSGCHHMSRTVLSVTDIKQNIHSSGYTLSIHLSGYLPPQ